MTCAKMEADGSFDKNPKLKALAEYKYAKSKDMQYVNVDYQKTGKPIGVQGMTQ